jgi:hypothetical protein
MNRLVLIVLSLVLVQTVSAGCCIIKDKECTYWELENWSNQENFCSFFSKFGMQTSWDSKSCSEISIPTGCTDGWTSNSDLVKVMQEGDSGGGGRGVCSPKWQCSVWSGCANGLMKRACTDQNSCGYESPATNKSCTAEVDEQTATEAELNNSIVAETTAPANQPNSEILTGQATSSVMVKPKPTTNYAIGVITLLLGAAALFLGYKAARKRWF